MQIKYGIDRMNDLISEPARTLENSIGSTLRPSRFDQISATLLSLNVLLGFLLLVMVVVWLGPSIPPRVTLPDDILVIGSGGDDQSGGDEDAEIPGQTQVAFDRILQAIPNLNEAIESVGSGASPGKGRGEDNPRTVGPGQPIDPQWRVHYSVDDFDDYQMQIAYFGIEIGVVRTEGSKITRISNWLGGSPKVTESTRERENELGSVHFIHRENRLKRWGKAVAETAGVSTESAIIVEFYPAETLNLMKAEESEALRIAGRSIDEVEETEFILKEVNGVATIVVHNIVYR